MSKNIKTTVVISSEAKGFEKSTTASKKLSLAIGDIGYSTDKGAKKATSVLKRLNNTFKGSTDEMKKRIEEVTSRFEALDSVSFKDAQKNISTLTDYLKDLEKEQVAVAATLDKIEDKGSDAFKNLEAYAKGLNATVRTTNAELKYLKTNFEKIEDKQKRGGMGALGGALIGGAVGYGVGRATQAGGQALFGGVGGLQQALGAIPWVGQVAAGQIGMMAGFTGQHMQYEQALLGAAPYKLGLSETQALRAAQADLVATRKRSRENKEELEALTEDEFIRAKILSDKEKAATTVSVTERGQQALGLVPKAGDTKSEGAVKGFLAGMMNPYQAGYGAASGLSVMNAKNQIRMETEDKEAVIEGRKIYKEELGNLTREIAIKKGAYEKRASNLKAEEARAKSSLADLSPGMDLAKAGVTYLGKNKIETMQIFSQLMQAGGGYGPEAIKQQNLRDKAFAAQSAFGIDVSTSGAFLKAGRRGGLAGGRGQAGNELESAISQGLLLGLQGSEINQWMQEIAQGISEFQQTGIEVNYRSISSLATEIGKAGISGTRSLAMAQGASNYIQGMGSRGVTSGFDLFLLQGVGGYKGGSTKDYLEAIKKMEKFELEAGGKSAIELGAGGNLTETLKRLVLSLPEGTGDIMLRSKLEGMGVKGSGTEFEYLAASLRGKVTPEQLKDIEREEAIRQEGRTSAAILSDKKLLGLGASTVSAEAPTTQSMARIQNRQMEIGADFADKMVKLEANATRMTSVIQKLSDEALTKVIDGLITLADTLVDTAGRIKEGGITSIVPPML